MKTLFNKSTFITGTPAYVEKHGTEYPVKFMGTSTLIKFPMTAAIGQDDNPDYVLVNAEGVLNTGETCYMKKAVAAPAATQIAGSKTGWVNIYKNDEGKLIVGTRIHSTQQAAKDKAKNAESVVVASGVQLSW